MIKASSSDKALVIDILARAFDANPSVNYIVRQDGRREKRIRSLMDYSFELCQAFGAVYLSADRKGCALVLLPEKKKTTIRTLMLDLRLVVGVTGLRRVGKILAREAKIKKGYPQLPFYYLWFLGVAPEQQGRGIGSMLLQDIIEESRQLQRPVYLETSLASNIGFYRRWGFEVYREILFDQPLYCMRRPITLIG
ncbi:N-acetyltransferase [Cesiribacter sp. SM1]|uniref:GNAT family N-acetyltransferase n=1 Tax=Cesiribacter sp. SM1 TaxID=2861196 RepID=UPI001CD4CAD0|nr:GNAT family N-acetyltransferase [Cesiribacter sp. SM1]